ncbi:MAG TPA: hypothetical protein VNK96_03080 [Fimbriimonadales bacterium]|nr:hypothetical protein [Fimbriimonadales bacterium]
MNAAQQHLLLNHLPVIGSLFCLLLLAYGLARRSEDIQKVTLGILVLIGLLAIPTYLTGEPAEEVIEHLPGFSNAHVEAHESMAKITLFASLALGVFSLGVLIFSRGRKVPTVLAFVVLLGNLTTFAVTAYTAHLGGQIRHTEIRAIPQPPPIEEETGEHLEL